MRFSLTTQEIILVKPKHLQMWWFCICKDKSIQCILLIPCFEMQETNTENKNEFV